MPVTTSDTFDTTDIRAIRGKVAELEAELKTNESVGWNLCEDPELPERLGGEVVNQMKTKGYITYVEGTGTVVISRNPK
jgi:hypothetical protein